MDSGAHLTFGEKDTIRKSTEPAVITTRQRQGRVDVFVAMALLEDSPAVLSLGLLSEEIGKSENHVPTVAVFS